MTKDAEHKVFKSQQDPAVGARRLNFKSRLKFDSYVGWAFNYLIKSVFYDLI